jgi:hypothetical protein
MRFEKEEDLFLENDTFDANSIQEFVALCSDEENIELMIILYVLSHWDFVA